MTSLTAVRYLLPGDSQRSRSGQSGVTGGPKPNSSWPSWERSSDLGTCGGFPTCATKTAGVSALAAVPYHQKSEKLRSSPFCRRVLHPIRSVHVYVRSSLVLPWDFCRTVHEPGRNHLLEKDMSAFPRCSVFFLILQQIWSFLKWLIIFKCRSVRNYARVLHKKIDFHPNVLSGMGYASHLIIAFSGTSYIIIIAWAFFYLFSSFSADLPWATCGNYWNTGRFPCVAIWRSAKLIQFNIKPTLCSRFLNMNVNKGIQ